MSAWSLVCHSAMGEAKGSVSVVYQDGGQFKVRTFDLGPASGLEEARRPFFLGLSGDGVLLMDPATKALRVDARFPEDAFPAYAYPEFGAGRLWFNYDGDQKTGNDPVNCRQGGSSVTVIRNAGEAQVLKTLCVGRGHHVSTFTAPSAAAPDVPRKAFVSNLLDGTITVLGNDPEAADYLEILDLINLCEAQKEDSEANRNPNNAFPHGMVYSPVTGKVYNLNNGYGTIAVIDPASHAIEKRIELKKSSNLLLSPDARFIIGKGADRKSNQEHVLGSLSVVDVEKGEVVNRMTLEDVYPSTYRFNRAGTKLYVTTASTGNETQKANLKQESILVFDATALPELKLLKEIEVGLADCGRRPLAFYDDENLVFAPNPTDGTLSIIDGNSDDVLGTVTLTNGPSSEVLFSFWDGVIHGC